MHISYVKTIMKDQPSPTSFSVVIRPEYFFSIRGMLLRGVLRAGGNPFFSSYSRKCTSRDNYQLTPIVPIVRARCRLRRSNIYLLPEEGFEHLSQREHSPRRCFLPGGMRRLSQTPPASRSQLHSTAEPREEALKFTYFFSVVTIVPEVSFNSLSETEYSYVWVLPGILISRWVASSIL